MPGAEIKVTGLFEFRNAIRSVDEGLPNQMRAKLSGIAGMVKTRAIEKLRADVKVWGKGTAAKSYKVVSQQTGAGLKWGGDAAPYLPWLDFGGTVGRGHKQRIRHDISMAQQGLEGAIRRPFIKGGRYVYPAIKELEPQIAQALDDAMKSLAEKAGFETRGGL